MFEGEILTSPGSETSATTVFLVYLESPKKSLDFFYRVSHRFESSAVYPTRVESDICPDILYKNSPLTALEAGVLSLGLKTSQFFS